RYYRQAQRFSTTWMDSSRWSYARRKAIQEELSHFATERDLANESSFAELLQPIAVSPAIRAPIKVCVTKCKVTTTDGRAAQMRARYQLLGEHSSSASMGAYENRLSRQV
ncbi:MAG TPA: hypothetical protein VGJ60_36595, partial [Chloroflexota bacterium]